MVGMEGETHGERVALGEYFMPTVCQGSLTQECVMLTESGGHCRLCAVRIGGIIELDEDG